MKNFRPGSTSFKKLAQLKLTKHQKPGRLFLIEGPHLVEEARRAGQLVEAWSLDGRPGTTLVSLKTLQKLSTTKTPPPVVGLGTKPVARPLGERVLVLHQLQDPGNVGTLIRSALAFGFESVIVIGTAVFSPKVIRATQGAIFRINVVEQRAWPTDLCDTHTCWAAVTQAGQGQSVEKVKASAPLALILGNEGQGLPDQIVNLAQAKVWVPVSFESLNVASAGAVIMSHFSRDWFGEKG